MPEKRLQRTRAAYESSKPWETNLTPQWLQYAAKQISLDNQKHIAREKAIEAFNASDQ